jgi:signal recognition particle subunit SRP54
MIPGFPQEMLQAGDEDPGMRMKRMIFIMDSMSSAELDSDGSIFLDTALEGGKQVPVGLSWRVTRVARGSGTSVREVEEVLSQHRVMANMAKSVGGKNGWMQSLQKAQQAMGAPRGPNGMPTPQQIQAMQVRRLWSHTHAAEPDTATLCSDRCRPVRSSRCSARCAAAACRT